MMAKFLHRDLLVEVARLDKALFNMIRVLKGARQTGTLKGFCHKGVDPS